MKLRSLLFVPGDSDRKLSRAAGTGADALVLDLEDSVVTARKPVARAAVRDFLLAHSATLAGSLWVRINPLPDPASGTDLEAVIAGRPRGIMLPKAVSADDVRALAGQLDRLESRHGLIPGSTRILPICTETPRAVFTLQSYAGCSNRLAALTWGAEDLGSAIGASATRDANGEWTAPYQMVRSLCLFAAHAAAVTAIDTLHADFRDHSGLQAAAVRARRDGFGGMLAIHPDQVAVINAAFTPAREEIEYARRVVEAFSGHPGSGVLSLDGRMLDAPHLRQAQRLLALAEATDP
jgi:citrate lyase subunit beta/citryl-CoA lyase